MTNHETDELAVARATNQRLNARAQRLESELAAYRRAIAQWEINKRGTYIPHASLRAIGLASGKDILGSVRHLKHFERVEQAEAAIERVRRLHDALDAETDLTSPDHEITRGAAAKKIAAALDGWSPPAAVSVPPPAPRADAEAVARVRALHVPDDNGECQHCRASYDPCPTIRALDGEQPAVGPCVAGEQQNETPDADGLGEPAELRDLPREVRHLVHAVDRMRSDWAEAPEGGPERREMWTAVHAACDAVWNRMDTPAVVAQPVEEPS